MAKKKRGGDNRMDQWPAYLRGEAQNKHHGHQVQKVRTFRGVSLGAANAGRSLPPDELAIEAEKMGLTCSIR